MGGAGGWETYDGAVDGAWVQVASGAGYEVGGLSVYPNAFSIPSSGAVTAGVVHFDPVNQNSGINTVYAQKFSISGKTVAGLGATRSLSTGGNIYATDMQIADSSFVWGHHDSWQASSYVTGWTHDSTGLLSATAGGSAPGNANYGTVRQLDSTRALCCQDGTTSYLGVAVHTRSGTTLGSIGSRYNLAATINKPCTAIPNTASHSLAAYVDASYNFKVQGLQHPSTTVSQLVPEVTVANLGASYLGCGAMSDPLDGFGVEPNRFCAVWFDGALKAAIIGFTGTAITIGTAVTIGSASGTWFGRPHSVLVLGAGTIMVVGSNGRIFPLYYNPSSAGSLTLTASPRALTSGGIQAVLGAGPTSGMMGVAISPTQFLLCGPTGSGIAAKIVACA